MELLVGGQWTAAQSGREEEITAPWWDVAPAEVPEVDTVPPLREDYETGRRTQRWLG